MPRRAVIDREELFEAANKMAADGKDVTALALLNALGGGSLTTIYKYLADWETGRPKTAPPAGSAEIPDVVQNAFASTWRVAVMEATRETTAAKEKAADEVKTAQKQFEGALEAIQKLEAELEQDGAEIEDLKLQVSELETALTKSGNENAALKATAEQLSQRVKSQETELERVHNDIQTERRQHHDEMTRLQAEHAAAQEKANKEIERLREELDRERSETQFRLQQASSQLVETGKRVQTAEYKRDVAVTERDAAIKEASELRGQVQGLTAQNSALVTSLAGSSARAKKDKTEG